MSNHYSSMIYHAGLLLEDCKSLRVEYRGEPVFNEKAFHMERNAEFQVALFPANDKFNIKVDLVHQSSPMPEDG